MSFEQAQSELSPQTKLTAGAGVAVEEVEYFSPKTGNSKARKTTRNAAGQPSQFVELSDFIAAHPTLPLPEGAEVCIITNELAEFHQNGGLGTANSGLIHAFAGRNYQITVIYTAPLDAKAPAVRAGMQNLKARGINFLCLEDVVAPQWMETPRKISYACYWYVRQHNFALVHFNDYLGNAFYTAQAKRTGTVLEGTVVAITVHGPTKWAKQIDQKPLYPQVVNEISFLEHRAIELADVVIGVSHHLLGWLAKDKVALPRHSYVHKNILPDMDSGAEPVVMAPHQLNEVVFFARQDLRKGFIHFVNAIKLLAPKLPQIKFTFLGKFSHINCEHSGAYALDELAGVPNLISFVHDYDRDMAMAYLKRPGVLAAIPSLDENSPCTVFECIVAGIPFIATDVGGIPELVHPDDHDDVLIAPTAKALADKIIAIYGQGYSHARLGFDPAVIESQMFEGLAGLVGVVNQEAVDVSEALKDQTPLVSVVVTHFNRSKMLDNLLNELKKQTYPNFEVVVIDDGSTKPVDADYIRNLDTTAYPYPLTVKRIKNSYLGAARNAGAKLAKGEFLKFQDDDNIPMPHELEYFVRSALNSGADIVTGMSRFFVDDEDLESDMVLSDMKYLALGQSLPISLNKNEYGDANALVRKSVFDDVGGFTELYGIGFEDYEFFIKAESLGKKILFNPEPLFNYRVGRTSMLQTTSSYLGMQRVKNGIQVLPGKWLDQIIEIGMDHTFETHVRDQAWYRASKRKWGELHQQMMGGDAASSENLSRLLDLAVKYGRFEDVVLMMLKHKGVVDSLNWLNDLSKRAPTVAEDSGLHRPRLLRLQSFENFDLFSPTEERRPKWPVFKKDDHNGLLVHPLLDQITAVMVKGAIPKGTRKITVSFNHHGHQGEPASIAIGVSCAGFSLAESEWTELAQKEKRNLVLTFSDPVQETSDLIIKTTVTGSQDYAWVYAERLYIE